MDTDRHIWACLFLMVHLSAVLKANQTSWGSPENGSGHIVDNCQVVVCWAAVFRRQLSPPLATQLLSSPSSEGDSGFILFAKAGGRVGRVGK